MELDKIDIPLKNTLLSLFETNKNQLFSHDTPTAKILREAAIRNFEKLGFPDRSLEKWKSTDLTETLLRNYKIYVQSIDGVADIEDIFTCHVTNLDTYVITQVNGWVNAKNRELTTLPGGAIVGSLELARKKYPELIDTHYGKYAEIEKNALNAINTAFSQDGIFIYLPDNVHLSKPIQIVNIINRDENIFVQPRHLVIVGKNSKLTLLHCDHSTKHQHSFSNAVTEIYIGENSHVDHYKIQNKDNDSTLISNTYIHQEANSQLLNNTITLNGGLIRDNLHVKMNGAGCDSNLYGLYLVDRTQHVDHNTFVDHAAPHCRSNELYKGILDEQAKAVFNGHILVRKDSQKTIAYQNNKNILLTDEARINAKPHLEIYADDVKCSHGATVGQLDPEAMFYLRSRGICEHSAKMLLMYAFAAEVINTISIEPLKEQINDLVSRRLRGELSGCEHCALGCKGCEEINLLG